MSTAASLTPTVSGLGNLTGLSLVPGVYSGGELSLDGGGILTLAGSATSVWVFTASTTLVTGSASAIVLTGGASACNVFWRVGSSATLGTDSDFVGTVMAEQSITATTGTDVVGRLLAAGAAVTLDTTDVTVPTGCAAAGTVGTNGGPVFTSGSPVDATVGESYAFTVSATGTPAPTFAVTAGNGVAPDASTIITLTVTASAAAPMLPATGAATLASAPALAALAAGIILLRVRRAPRHVASGARRR